MILILISCAIAMAMVWFRLCRSHKATMSKLWHQKALMDLLMGRRPQEIRSLKMLPDSQRFALLLMAAHTRNSEYFGLLLRKGEELQLTRQLKLVQAILKPNFVFIRRRLLKSGLIQQTDNLSQDDPIVRCSNPHGVGCRMILDLLSQNQYQHAMDFMRCMADHYDGNGHYLGVMIRERLISPEEIRAYKTDLVGPFTIME